MIFSPPKGIEHCTTINQLIHFNMSCPDNNHHPTGAKHIQKSKKSERGFKNTLLYMKEEKEKEEERHDFKTEEEKGK